MERYSEVHPSKWQSKYSEEFKRFICNEYLNGSSTRRELVAKYKIGNSRLTYWLREKGIYHASKRIYHTLKVFYYSFFVNLLIRLFLNFIRN
jgi:hypothetical protein